MLAESTVIQLLRDADVHDIESTTSGVIYLGFADKADPPAVADVDTAAKFAICKITNPSGEGTVTWTNGSRTLRNQVWGNRASLTNYQFVKE